MPPVDKNKKQQEIDISVLKTKFDRIESDVCEIKEDVKALLKFRYQVAGIVVAISGVFTFVLNVILK